MNILIDSRPLVDAKSGGVRRVGRSLVPALLEAFPEHHFFLATTGTRKTPLPFDLPKNAERLHKGWPNKLVSFGILNGLFTFDRLFPEARAERFLLLNPGFIGRTRLPFALLLHDMSFVIEPRWFSRKARLWHRAADIPWLTKKATRLFAVSACTKRDVARLFPETSEKIRVLPMSLNPLPRHSATAYPPQVGCCVHVGGQARLPTKFVLSFGASDPRKNTACAKIAAERLGIELVNVSGVSDAELSWLLQSARALLYPSWYEGFGLPLHEAAAFGTPCIASTAGALPETAPTGTLFADPAKPQQWVEALHAILARPEAFRTNSGLKPWKESSNEMQTIFTDFL